MSTLGREALHSQDLLNHSTDWGVAVAEPTVRKTALSIMFFASSIVAFSPGALISIPIITVFGLELGLNSVNPGSLFFALYLNHPLHI